MKKFYSVLALSLIVLFTSCSKESDPTPDTEEEVAAAIIGSWTLTAREQKNYEDEKLISTYDDVDTEDPEIMTLKADGTGKSFDSKETFSKFTYSVTTSQSAYYLKFSNYISYINNEPFREIPNFSLSIKAIEKSKLILYEEFSQWRKNI